MIAVNKTDFPFQGCPNVTAVSATTETEWLEQPAVAGFLKWHILFMTGAGVFTLTILICCCISFRIPRTKQEIEADYVRKKLTRKFRRQLRTIQNAELDEMDLKKALDRVRCDFKSDTESLAQSEALSVGSVSSCPSPTYRKASEINIGLSLEDIQAQNRGLRGRMWQMWDSFVDRVRGRKTAAGDVLTEKNPAGDGLLQSQLETTNKEY